MFEQHPHQSDSPNQVSAGTVTSQSQAGAIPASNPLASGEPPVSPASASQRAEPRQATDVGRAELFSHWAEAPSQSLPDGTSGSSKGGEHVEAGSKDGTKHPEVSPAEAQGRVSVLRQRVGAKKTLRLSQHDLVTVNSYAARIQALTGRPPAPKLAAGPEAAQIPNPRAIAAVAVPAPAILELLGWLLDLIAGIALIDVLLIAAVVALVVMIVVIIERALEFSTEPWSPPTGARPQPNPQTVPDGKTATEEEPAPGPGPSRGPQSVPVEPLPPEPRMHRGNIHVQGEDMTTSEDVANFAWNRPQPMTKAEASVALDRLRSVLTRSELKLRNEAFQKAERWIDNNISHAPPMVFRTFQNSNCIKDRDRKKRTARVDIEIVEGTAFV